MAWCTHHDCDELDGNEQQAARAIHHCQRHQYRNCTPTHETSTSSKQGGSECSRGSSGYEKRKLST